jgi:hypothetical protein
MRLNKKSISVVDIAHKEEKSPTVLSMVRFTKEFAEATDGFRLVRVTNPPLLDGIENDGPEGFEACLISRDAVKKLKGIKEVLIDRDGEHFVIVYPGLNRQEAPYTVRPPVTGPETWPVHEGIFPQGPAEYRVLFNPYLLMGLCKIAAQFGDTAVMELRGERGPIYIESTDNEQSMRGLLQPIRPKEEPQLTGNTNKKGKAYTIRKDRKSQSTGGEE